ncbi:MAG TPA: cation diffusion facilitator family transporter [Actinomycetota bacterium]|nr:cation diffusion facilitator family transporter [Actinomycetota bacterium]
MGDHDHDHGVGQPHDDDHDHDDGGHDHGDEHAHGGGHGHDHGHDAGHDHDHGHGSGHDHGHEHGGIRGLIAGVFSPHSHDAADSVDAALTASADGLRALKISLAGLAVTAVLQAVIFALSGSVALLGDTIHNFADALTAVPLGIAFLVGRRPANERYTYGYGRAEDLAGIFVVAMIALSSALAAWEAIRRLMHPATVHNLVWVMAGGVLGFAGNELVAVYRIRVGRRIGSAALVADGLHARTDGLTSLAVVIGAAGVAAGLSLADPIVGLLITLAILVVLKDAARDIYRRLMDSVDPGLVDTVRRVLAGVPGVEAVESVQIRWVGHELLAEADIASDAGLNLADAHAIAEEAHHRLLHDVPRLAQATIHSNPVGDDGRDHHAVTAHHFPRTEDRRQ